MQKERKKFTLIILMIVMSEWMGEEKQVGEWVSECVVWGQSISEAIKNTSH